MTGDDRDNKTVLRDDDEAEADGFGDNVPESFLRPVRAFCLVARKEDQITKKRGRATKDRRNSRSRTDCLLHALLPPPPRTVIPKSHNGQRDGLIEHEIQPAARDWRRQMKARGPAREVSGINGM